MKFIMATTSLVGVPTQQYWVDPGLTLFDANPACECSLLQIASYLSADVSAG